MPTPNVWLRYGFELDNRIIPRVTITLLMLCVPLVYHFTFFEHRPTKPVAMAVVSAPAPKRIIIQLEEYANEQQRMSHKLKRAAFMPAFLAPLPLGPR